LLIKKKNYAGIKWTPSKVGSAKVPGFGFELDMKGIDAVRRDRTKFVRELSEQLLNVLLIENNAKGSLDVLSSKIQDLLHDRVPISDFVLSKSLKGSYASENVPHVQAWRRMQARGDAGCPSKGGRMPILIVEPYGEFARTAASKVPL
jgi:DNA polymerase elongation subunit (family B)